MKKMKRVFNRYNVLNLLTLILVGVLMLRLANLTLVQGSYYRELSNTRRLKEIEVTGPRGEIRDRYGRLLAGNKPSFTVQMSKDELNIKDKKEKNNILLGLVRLLEEDGASYIDSFPIDLNVFKYIDSSINNEANINANERVIDILIENNLISELLSTNNFYQPYDEHYRFSLKDKALYILNEYDLDPEDRDDTGLIGSNLLEDKIMMRKLISHPISRKSIYDFLERKGLAENIYLEEYSISFDNEYMDIKRELSNSFDFVNADTTAKEDFINLVKTSSLKSLLQVTKLDEENDKVFAPGQKLLDMVSKKRDIPMEIAFSEDKQNIIYNYRGENLEKEPVEILIDLAKEENLLDDFIIDDEIKFIAQQELLNNGINARISVSKDFEYAPINNKINWLNSNGVDEYENNEDLFNKIKKNYEIDPSLSKYESKSILFLHDKLNKQGHMAYQPINVAYGIKDTTVAKIEEQLVEYPGINISVEPVRYYPQGETAAHILGYLGKISQAGEIEKYVVEKKYSPNDIIGKTGVEESFEDLLRGTSGRKKVEVDVFGNTTKIIDSEKSVPGNNLYLTIDSKLQKVAEKALEKNLKAIQTGGIYESPWGDYKVGINKGEKRPYSNATSGAVVAIDVKTGELLAMSSFPSYDPNLFSTGISSADWASLFPEDERDSLAPRPLYNIASQTAVQPGSVFKMVTGLAGLEKGLSPSQYINARGYVEVGTDTLGCWIWNQSRGVHGNMNLSDALRDSCNYYFYSLALGENQRTKQNIGVKVEIEDIVDVSKKLGLNDKTGIEINIPSEYSGGVPNPQRKIILSKRRLSNYLSDNIKEYVKKDKNKTQSEINDIIEEIVSWLEYDIELTRGQVVSNLESMDIDSNLILPGNNGRSLTDIIKYDYLKFAGWTMHDTLQVTIGQGESSYTPIQMANYIATIANGGYRNQLTLVKNVKNYNNSVVLLENQVESDRIDLNDYENLEHVKKGMLEVTTRGTAKDIFKDFPIRVGAKTGTAQKEGNNPVTGEKYDGFAWFVAFAPYDEPEIAIATVIFQGGSGGYAGPLTRDIMAEYLGLNVEANRDLLPFNSILVQ